MIVRDFLICLLQMYLLEDLEKNMLPYRRENFLGKFLVYFVIALVMLGINHLESSIFNMVMIPVTYMMWSREAPPCHITMVGSHHPLREPDLHLSMYPALLSFGQQLLTGCGLQHGIFCTQPAFYAVLQSLQPPMPACP